MPVETTGWLYDRFDSHFTKTKKSKHAYFK